MTTNYRQITAGQLTLADVDKDAIVLDGGNSFVGKIAQVNCYGRTSYGSKAAKVNIVLKSGSSSLTLSDLPLEFVLQIVDGESEEEE